MGRFVFLYAPVHSWQNLFEVKQEFEQQGTKLLQYIFLLLSQLSIICNLEVTECILFSRYNLLPVSFH